MDRRNHGSQHHHHGWRTACRANWPSLAIDGADGLHVAFQFMSEQLSQPMFARRPAGATGWIMESPHDSGGLYTSIALDPSKPVSDAESVVYSDNIDGRIHAAWHQAGQAVSAPLIDARSFGPVLAIDAQGTWHVAYAVYNGGLMYQDSTARTVLTTDSCQQPSMVLAANDEVHLVCAGPAANGTTDLRYGHRATDGTWSWSTLAPGWPGGPQAIVMDAAGGLHVLFLDFASANVNASLKLAERGSDGTWNVTTLDDQAIYNNQAAIAIDAHGGLHVAATDYVDAKVRAGYRPAGGAWQFETVDSDAMGSLAIVADSVDGTHIVYNAGTQSSDLRYAYRGCPR